MSTISIVVGERHTIYHCVAECKSNDLETSFKELDKWLLRYEPLKRGITDILRERYVNYFNSSRIETYSISLYS